MTKREAKDLLQKRAHGLNRSTTSLLRRLIDLTRVPVLGMDIEGFTAGPTLNRMAEYLDCTTRQVTTIIATLQDKKYDPPLITVIPFAGKFRQNLFAVNLASLMNLPLKSAANKQKILERKQAKAERNRRYRERLKIVALKREQKLQAFDDYLTRLPPDEEKS